MLINRWIKFTVLLLFLETWVVAQEPLIIEHLVTEPAFDGNLYEPAWDSVKAYSMIMHNPVSGNPASQVTNFKIGYTDKYLYVAGYMFDTEPSQIRAVTKKRDDMSLSNDWFGFNLDVYNDNETALFFGTTPAGLRLDGLIFNDGQGDFPVQQNWNTLWDVRTSVSDKGWFAEIQIPLSSLRYTIIDSKAIMGFGAYRYISRLAEWDTYPRISNEWGFWSWAKPSQYKDFELSGVKSVNPLYFTPYLLGGVETHSVLNETEVAYNSNISWEKAIGMDAKIGLSKNMTLDLTVNTDFAQVEADDQQVNLTRFSLFFPEKRQFFLERSSIFDFMFGSTGYLFYSRRIGIYDEQQIPIWGGGRLTGRAGPWDIGVMTLQTGFKKDPETDEEILPSINNSVLRLRRQVTLNSNSYLGAMITSKVDVNGKYNIAYGFDAILNLFKNDYLNIVAARTMDSDSGKQNLIDPSKIYLLWQRRTYKGLSYDACYSRAGNRYNPELGFEYRGDYTRYGSTLGYGWIPGNKSKHLKQHKISTAYAMYSRNQDHRIESLQITPRYQFTTKKDRGFNFSFPFYYESVLSDFDLSPDATIVAGDYTFYEGMITYQSPAGSWLYWETTISSGKFYDGWKNSFSISPSFKLGESWNIDLNYYINQINFGTRDQKFLSHLAGLKVLYMFSTAISASSYLQYNSLSDDFIWNIRFRYNPKEGNDFFIVYNDNINSERDSYDPPLPFSNQRTILLKYTYTFRVR
jgi:Domain of unknown function (DUF5916)